MSLCNLYQNSRVCHPLRLFLWLVIPWGSTYETVSFLTPLRPESPPSSEMTLPQSCRSGSSSGYLPGISYLSSRDLGHTKGCHIRYVFYQPERDLPLLLGGSQSSSPQYRPNLNVKSRQKDQRHLRPTKPLLTVPRRHCWVHSLLLRP